LALADYVTDTRCLKKPKSLRL